MTLSNPIFKHIISIGYEFETHDISKLTLVDDTFVNSGLNMKNLNHRVKTNKAKKIDDHYYSIQKKYSTKKMNEYIDDPDMDGNVPNKDIMMHTVIDTGNNDFESQLKPHCKNKNKNSLYAFKLDDQLYPIKFSDALIDQDCFTFSGVEWIITYYKPKTSSNIILDTYVDACYRIINQLAEFKKKTGPFLIRSTKTLIGYKYRHIYHKPGTTFYFMQKNDGRHTNTDRNTFSLDDIECVPQMTICVNSLHAMDVMDALLKVESSKNTRHVMYLKKLHAEFSLIHKCSALLIPGKSDNAKKAVCMLSLILLKVFIYVNKVASAKLTDDDYFKDFLCFAVRHSNTILYNRLKELVQFELDPSILKPLYKKYKSALTKKCDKTHEDFGDPTFSLQSYFDYLDTGKDWFEDNYIIGFVAMFDFKDDNLMIENRIFPISVTTMMVDRNIKMGFYSPSIKFMKQFNSQLIEEKTVTNLQGKMYNPTTKRYTKKCKLGEVRNKNFTCVKKNKGISYIKINSNELEYLKKHAIEQATEFKDVFPWEQDIDTCYVALELQRATLKSMIDRKLTPHIYGWLNVSFSTWKTYKIAYVTHIATRTNKTLFKGIGTELMKLMEKDIAPTTDFIKLAPLASVVGFYEQLGYTECLRNKFSLFFMCKTLNRDIPPGYLKHLEEETKYGDF
jgi:hypothetical protein